MAVFYKYQYTNKRKNIHPWLHVCMMQLKFCDGQGDSRSRMYAPCMIHKFTMLYSDT